MNQNELTQNKTFHRPWMKSPDTSSRQQTDFKEWTSITDEWPLKLSTIRMTFQSKPCVWKLPQCTATAFITLIRKEKYRYRNTAKQIFSRAYQWVFFLATIHFMHHNARQIRILKAKFLFSALHVHNSCFKMLGKTHKSIFSCKGSFGRFFLTPPPPPPPLQSVHPPKSIF